MKFKFLLTIFLGVFSLGPVRAGSQEPIDRILQIGDSVLYAMDTEGARVFYDSVANSSQADDYYYYLALYKTGYSYIHEKEDFLALAYFTEVQLGFEPKTSRDSALTFLNNLEVDALAFYAVAIDYDEGLLEKNYKKWSPKLSGNYYYRTNYLMSEIYNQRLQYDKFVEYLLKNIGPDLTDIFLREHTYYKLLWGFGKMYAFNQAIDYGTLLLSEELYYLNKPKVIRILSYSYSAKHDFNGALSLFINNQGIYDMKSERDQFEYVSALTDCARYYVRLGELEKGDSLFNLASGYTLILKNSPNLINTLYDEWAVFYKLRGELEQALEKISFGKRLLDSTSSNKILWSWFLQHEAQIYRELGDFETAFKLLNDAVSLRRPKGGKYVSNESQKYYAALLRTKFFTYRRYYEEGGEDGVEKLLEAHEGFKEVLQIYLGIQSDLTGERKISVVRELRMDYENLFLTAFYLYKATGQEQYLNELFNYSHEGRFIHFKGQLDFNNFLIKDELTDELQEKEKTYKLSIERIRFILNNEEIIQSPDMKENLHEELVIAQKKYDSILVVINKEKEKLPDDRKGEEPNIPLHLDENQALLSYFITESRLFLLYEDKHIKEVREVNVRDTDMIELARSFGNMIHQNPTGSTATIHDFKLKSNKLYEYLIRPIEHKMKGKQLFIMPDQELSFVPFDLLLADTLGQTYGELNYLIRHYPISELYTLRQLDVKKKLLKLSNKFAAFAPSYSLYAEDSIRSLPGAKKEIELLSGIFGGKVFVDDLATKENFFKYAPASDIIHIAAHTNVNENNPVHSQFLMTEKEKPLTLFEIYGTRFKAELLVLSSCNTGKGKLKAGDGVTNLARGFFYAGVNNVVLTKWAIADYTSATLMGNFYKYLSEGNSTDRALQKAKVRYLETADPLYMHPYYWAGYTSVGKPVGFGVYNAMYLYSILALVTIGLAFVFYRRKRATQISVSREE